MAIEVNLSLAEALFAGDDKAFKYEIFAAGANVESANALMEDVSGWTLSWSLRVAVGIAPHRLRGILVAAKTSGAGIEIEGVFNSDRAFNTQRVVVTLTDDDMAVVLRGGKFVHGLRREDAGHRAALSYGIVPVLLSAVE